VDLCRYVRAAVPHQQWDAATPDVWFDLGLSRVSATDARDAVKTMVRSKIFVDYTGIVEEVWRIRRRRTEGFDAGAPPDVDPDDVPAYLAQLRADIRAVADGGPPRESAGELVTRNVAQLQADAARTFKRVPRRD